MKEKKILHEFSGWLCIIFIMLGLSCASTDHPNQTVQQQPFTAETGQSATELQTDEPTTPPVPLYWTGDGGKGISLGILMPESQGLSPDQAYFPALVQGVLVANMSKYSAISILDRVSLDRVITETLDLTYEDNLDIVRLGHVAHVGNMMTGQIIRTSSGFNLQLNVTDTTPQAKTLAAYSGNFTTAELENLSALKSATADLLEQLGVILNERGVHDLRNPIAITVIQDRAILNQEIIEAQQQTEQVMAQIAEVQAHLALAKGVTAQKHGSEVAALSYFLQAASFDPSLQEAVNRSAILQTNITGGNIGDNVRNEIAWRRQWVERLAETEQFFHNYFQTNSRPCTLFYSNDITQGAINFRNETVTLSIESYLQVDSSWPRNIYNTVRAVWDGLEATGKVLDWELNSWPYRHSATNLNPFFIRGSNRGEFHSYFSVDIELLNNQNSVISRQTFYFRSHWYITESPNERGAGSLVRPRLYDHGDYRNTLNFENVNANDITDNMTIRFVSINGTDAETAVRNGVLQIQSVRGDEFARRFPRRNY